MLLELQTVPQRPETRPTALGTSGPRVSQCSPGVTTGDAARAAVRVDEDLRRAHQLITSPAHQLTCSPAPRNPVVRALPPIVTPAKRSASRGPLAGPLAEAVLFCAANRAATPCKETSPLATSRPRVSPYAPGVTQWEDARSCPLQRVLQRLCQGLPEAQKNRPVADTGRFESAGGAPWPTGGLRCRSQPRGSVRGACSS